MRRPTTTCIDTKTKMEVILIDCSFNAACMFLDRENSDNRFGKFLSVQTVRTSNKTEIKFEKSRFIYDENRGYLLKE